MGSLNERLEYVETPDFTDNQILQKLKYIDREERRINEGYQGLSGLHYFHLSKIKIKLLKGKATPPAYVDTDEKMINDFLWCLNYEDEKDELGNIREGWDLDIIKRRRAHFTTIFGGTIPMWLSVCDKYKGCTYPITSCDSTRLTDLIESKLKPALNSCIKEGLLPKDHYSNQEYMKFTSTKKGNENQDASTIYFLDTSKDDRAASKAEGTGNIAALIDERFLHQREGKVKMSFEATLYEGIKKTGILICGGSSGATNKDATKKIKDTIKASKTEGSKKKIEFIAGWDGLIVNEKGITDKEAGIDYILKRRSEYRKNDQWDELQNYIKNYPLSIEELISSVENDYFSPSIMHNLSKGKQFAFNTDPIQCSLLNRNGNIYTDNTPLKEPNLEIRDGKKFPYSILEQPIWGHTYIAGLDPIDFTGATAKGSLFSCVIKDITTNRYVASLEFRTSDPELGYNLWYNFMYYYKSPRYPQGALCLAEKNRVSSLLTMCKIKGTLNLLARDPSKHNFESDEDRGYFKSNNGTSTTVATIDRLLGYTKMYLEHNIVPFYEFNETFPNYDPSIEGKIKKSDICDAVLSCEYLSNHLYKGGSTDIEKKYRKEIVIERNSNGELEERIINVPIK